MKSSTKDQVKGKVDKIKGEIKEIPGHLGDKPELEGDNLFVGKVQEKADRIKKVIRK
jgi:uncharacterized protein YjbJ (UPF0337 family)